MAAQRRPAVGGAAFMVNYRVADLHGLLAALRSERVQVEDQVDESELWQPPDGQ